MLKGKTVFITGTNRGIGKAILEEFAINGANIIAHARKETQEFMNMISELSEKYDITITPIYFDMADTTSMKEEIKAKILNKIKIDVLINSAGIAHGGLFQMTSVSKIKDVFNINFFSQLELTQCLLRYMAKYGGGCIIFMSSVLGLDAKIGECAYGTSKAALAFFGKTLAIEVAPLNIRVNTIAPGLINTEMVKEMNEEFSQEMISNCFMKRMGLPAEIAKVAVFLASEKASYITGQVIRVDGGL